MFQNGQKVVVVSSGDERRVIKVQSASGTPDPSRYPIVDTTGVSGRDQSVQIVSGGDPTRFPILRGVSDARGTADSVISALSPAAWYRNATDVVSSGGFASIWADYASSDKGLVLPGVSGNYASAPDIAAYTLDGDWTMLFRLLPVDWTPGADYTIASHATSAGNQNGWEVRLLSAGQFSIRISPDGTGAAVEAVNSNINTLTDGVAYWIKITKTKASGAVTVAYAADSSEIPSSWTSITVGSSFSAALATFNSNASLLVGQSNTAGANFYGNNYRTIIYSDLTQTTKVFDADFSSQAIGAASFTESSSNAATVTINTSGAAPAHIGKARDLLQGTGTNQPAYSAGVFTFDGADNWMRATYASTQPRTRYIVYTPVTWSDTDHVINGSSANVALYQVTLTPRLEIFAGSSAAANTGHAVGALAIDCVVFNGASSSLRVNNNAKTTGNVGANNPGGFTIAAQNNGLAGWSNIAVYEAIDFAAAHSDAEQDSVITALANALSVTV